MHTGITIIIIIIIIIIPPRGRTVQRSGVQHWTNPDIYMAQYLTFWSRNYFFNFSTPVYKMWITQEPNKLELWNKLHFEEEKT